MAKSILHIRAGTRVPILKTLSAVYPAYPRATSSTLRSSTTPRHPLVHRAHSERRAKVSTLGIVVDADGEYFAV
jgi:hypothetical protein